jgi:hypothetical protein
VPALRMSEAQPARMIRFVFIGSSFGPDARPGAP